MPDIEERQAKIEGTLEQIDKRLVRIESEIVALRDELHNGLNSLRDELHNGLSGLREEMHGEINGVRGEINGLRSEMLGEINGVRGEIGELRVKIDTNFRWLVGIMITMWVTVTLGIISTILTIIFKS